ncbi:MAG: pantoate--beta-alanine ligase [Bacteroidota bacterium]
MPFQILKTIREMQEVSEKFRCEGKKIAVVPTMGYLHNGHTTLIERASSLADIVITTIFVNPTQFGPNEDFARYPRDFEHDKVVAHNAGSDIIFYPDAEEIYPTGFSSIVEVEGVSNILEGAFRPKHFQGVTTVVAKLLNITKPHIAVFGQKDAQQAFLIQKMVRDLNFDIDIIIAPIVREADGLAMSSRNMYLNEAERKSALVLFRSLQHAAERIRQGERSIALLRKEMLNIIQSGAPSQIDYIAFVDPATFSETEHLNQPEILVALAVRFGTTRLIDNSLIPITP